MQNIGNTIKLYISKFKTADQHNKNNDSVLHCSFCFGFKGLKPVSI